MPPNSKAKNFQKPMIKTDKLPVSTIIEKDGPIVDSPVAIDSEELHQEGSPQNSLPGVTHSGHQAPCENSCCKHCGCGPGARSTNVLPNNDNPFSGL